MKKKLNCYLRPYRRRWGLTQKELAGLLGCKTSAVISRLEQNGRIPSLQIAFALEIIFGTGPVELFPDLGGKVENAVLTQARELYDELQGNPSRANRIKLDFLEELLERLEARRKKRNL